MRLAGIFIVAAAALLSPALAFFSPKITGHGPPQVLRKSNASTLYSVAANAGYEKPILLAVITGATRYDMGYAYGDLLWQESVEDWNLLIESFAPNKLEQDVLFEFLDWEWEHYLSKMIPTEYVEELRGVGDAGRAHGVDELEALVRRGMVVANFPGDIASNIEWLLLDQLVPRRLEARARAAGYASLAQLVAATLGRLPGNRQCSMLGAWGSRTVGGKLYTMRNLDWLADTGIATNKLVTVFRPPGGKHAHATVGFAGMYGALTGMNSQGLTVHEAGDDSKRETFDGFAWVLRLRFLMENAGNLAEAQQVWNATANTLGMNHGVGSAADGRFMVLETMANYTALFFANDTREAGLVVDGQHVGRPVPEALWRTNHGYDPEFVAHAVGHPPEKDSLNRYMLLAEGVVGYAARGQAIGDLQAVNLTALVGDKGGSEPAAFLSCDKAKSGINVLSVTFVPQELRMFLAFEEGRHDKHVPACCGYYVNMTLSEWF